MGVPTAIRRRAASAPVSPGGTEEGSGASAKISFIACMMVHGARIPAPVLILATVCTLPAPQYVGANWVPGICYASVCLATALVWWI
jgi:hypothetical protein